MVLRDCRQRVLKVSGNFDSRTKGRRGFSCKATKALIDAADGASLPLLVELAYSFARAT
jgi:hypothetical protein